jgi:hypothetical protein
VKDADVHRGLPVRDGRCSQGGQRVEHVVGSEHQEILIRPADLTRNTSLSIPTGTRHAVDVATGQASCGMPASSLFVFADLLWATMVSNEMCAACKRAAF